MWRNERCEDKADKEGEAGNLIGLSMQPDNVSRRRNQPERDTSSQFAL